jgi:hypothetical protein
MAVDYSINRSNREAVKLIAGKHILAVIERLTSDLDKYDILIRDGYVGDIDRDGVLVTFELTEKERDVTEVEFEEEEEYIQRMHIECPQEDREEITEEDKENIRVDDLIADKEYNSRMLRGDYMGRLEA